MSAATQPKTTEPGDDRVPGEAGPVATEPGEGRRKRRRRSGDDQRPERRLPLRTRVILGTAGGILAVLGIAGLFLPFLQGILLLVIAAAVLSLTSLRVYSWLQRTVGDRWPGAWERVERFRTRVRWKLRRK